MSPGPWSLRWARSWRAVFARATREQGVRIRGASAGVALLHDGEAPPGSSSTSSAGQVPGSSRPVTSR